ncbi:MAG: TIGR00725 family protein [Deltaproteobacteria bacterium]|nr:MAG: TIGR00725 family protein [Deltaproteobacteria bacterium]
MTKNIIGVFGPGNVSSADKEWQAALSVGQQLAHRGYVVLTGGLGGIMTAACKGAKEAGGLTVGILPGTRKSSPANRYVDIPIYTGMGEARNAINVKSCRAAIAIGGEYGTLSEIALALKGDCPIILLDSWSIKPHDGTENHDLLIAGTPDEAVNMAVAAVEGKSS